MRISDWSSDVCSSDLGPRISAGTLMADDFDRAMTSPLERVARTLAGHALSRNAEGDMASAGEAVDALWGEYSDAALAVLRTLREPSAAMLAVGDAEVWDRMIHAAIEEETIRSEEQTTELKTLMRISYAVFCLKKK